MPVTDQPSGQFITDQKGLEKVFRQNYDKYVEMAKKHLGEHGASAPRIVSKAFNLAWQDRKKLATMADLDAFIGAQIHHGAVREQSRVAGLKRLDHGAAHKEKHEVHEMSVDEAWKRLEGTLQGGSNEAYRERASTARHEAADHMKGLAKERNYKPLIYLAAGALVVIAVAGYFISKSGEGRAIERALTAGDVRKTETGSGQQANVTLDDGTIVTIGPETKLTVPKRFGMTGGFRAVALEGTANFKVERKLEKPFEVHIGLMRAIATGTEFAMRHFREDTVTVLHVKDGTVELRVGDDVRQVTKGMSFAMTNSGALRVPTTDELSEATAWTDGTLVISGRTLQYVLPQMKRWYGTGINVADKTLLSRPVFLSAPLNSPREAIASIEKSGGVKFTYIGENMAFEDTAKKAGATKTKKK